MRCPGLEIEQAAVGDRDLTARRIDGEAPAGIVGQCITEHRTRVGIDTHDDADCSAVGGILRHRAARQGGIGRRLVHVRHRDAERLIDAEPAPVSHPHRDGMRRRALEIEQAAVGDRDLAARRIDGEAPARVVGQRVTEHRARVGIDTGDDADRSAVGGILRHGVARQRRIRRCLIHVVDRDGDGLVEGGAGEVGRPHRQIV